MVDACTQWADATVLLNSTAKHTAEKFDQVWLCSKPHPQIIVHDNGTEFAGAEFQEMLSSYNIEAKQTTVKNPTANSLVKRIHSTLEDQLRIFFLATITLVKLITFFRLLFLQSGQPHHPIAHTHLLNLHMEWTCSFVNRFILTGWHSRQNARNSPWQTMRKRTRNDWSSHTR